MKPAGKQPPIGYILKALDTALSAYTDDALRPHQLTRLHWQTLNGIQQAGRVNLAHIFEELGQFADKERLRTVVGELEARQWLRLADHGYSLTPAGEEGLRLAGETQATVREQLTRGLTRGDYDAVIETLQKMLRNVTR
jgi:hypothetical protein